MNITLQGVSLERGCGLKETFRTVFYIVTYHRAIIWTVRVRAGGDRQSQDKPTSRCFVHLVTVAAALHRSAQVICCVISLSTEREGPATSGRTYTPASFHSRLWCCMVPLHVDTIHIKNMAHGTLSRVKQSRNQGNNYLLSIINPARRSKIKAEQQK